MTRKLSGPDGSIHDYVAQRPSVPAYACVASPSSKRFSQRRSIGMEDDEFNAAPAFCSTRTMLYVNVLSICRQNTSGWRFGLCKLGRLVR